MASGKNRKKNTKRDKEKEAKKDAKTEGLGDLSEQNHINEHSV